MCAKKLKKNDIFVVKQIGQKYPPPPPQLYTGFLSELKAVVVLNKVYSVA